jgi:ribokinase
MNMDLVVNLPRIPKVGETILGGEFKTFPGGKGANQAVAAARMGAKVSMVGAVGHDAFGKDLLEHLDAEGINSRFVRVIPGAATGVALIQVDQKGNNSICVAPGANFCLTNEDITNALEAIGNIDALMMPLETPIEQVYLCAKLASEMGAKVILNPAPAQLLDKDYLKYIDILIPNEHEVRYLIGKKYISPETKMSGIAQKLLSYGINHLLVTLGKEGSILFNYATENGILSPAFPVEAVDTTAAGDCFVGAFTVAFMEGKNFIESIRFASAAAAISVTRPGAQTSLPFREEVETFLNERSDDYEKNRNH